MNQNRGFHARNLNIPRSRGAISKALEKYTSLAQDAFSNGDRIVAENYFQYAEHYQRVLNETSPEQKEENNSVNPSNSISKDFQNNNERPSRTQRAIDGKNERLDRTNNQKKEEDLKKDGSNVRGKSFTSDGLEALKPFV